MKAAPFCDRVTIVDRGRATPELNLANAPKAEEIYRASGGDSTTGGTHFDQRSVVTDAPLNSTPAL